jgi:hypothetical protein
MYLHLLGFALAGASSAGATPTGAPLQPLAFLVDSCWQGTFPDGKAADTHCFTRDLGGQILRDRHTVTGGTSAYAGESVYAWDPESSRIRYEYWSTDGGHSSGSVIDETGRLVFSDERHVGADGTVMVIRSTWQRDGDDAYFVVTEQRDGDAWQEMWRMRMARVAPAAACGPAMSR